MDVLDVVDVVDVLDVLDELAQCPCYVAEVPTVHHTWRIHARPLLFHIAHNHYKSGKN